MSLLSTIKQRTLKLNLFTDFKNFSLTSFLDLKNLNSEKSENPSWRRNSFIDKAVFSASKQINPNSSHGASQSFPIWEQ